MKWLVSSACVFSVLLFSVVYAAPASTGLQVSTSASASTGGGGGGLAGILSNIDLPGLLQGVNSFVKLVGAFCPPLSQVLDNVIQNVTSTAFRVFGRAILRSGGLGGGSGGGASTNGGQRVNVVLPTFPPDEDYDDEDEASTVASTTSNAADDVSPASEFDSDDSANTIAKRHVRVVREAAEESAQEDQDGAESAPQPGQDLSDVSDQDRDKRYSPYGGDDHGHAGAAGSGNFLFDIIRNTADRAARTVGTVYRMVAGTDNAGGIWSLATAAADSTKTLATASSSVSTNVLPPKLVAGSGATEESDEHEHDAGAGGVAELDVVHKSADGYTEGIPGPITRLFVIANRGLANLVQDLILRLAQTSERLVNFKARLITALI